MTALMLSFVRQNRRNENFPGKDGGNREYANSS